MKKILLGLLFILYSSPAWATYTIGNHTSAHSAIGNAVTTSAIDTTSARAIIFQINADNSCSSITPSDSKNSSSAWQLLVTQPPPTNGVRVSVWLLSGSNIVVGSGHTFTTSAGTCYESLYVLALNSNSVGTGSTSDQSISSNVGAGTTVQAGPINPITSNEIVLSGLGMSIVNGTAASIDSGFTIIETQPQTDNSYGGALAYKIQTASAEVNPQWAYSPGGVAVAVNASLFDNFPTCTGSSPNLVAGSWADVQTCHDAAVTGDTITVGAGNYSTSANTRITKAVTIIASGTVNVTDNTNGLAVDLITLVESTAGNIRLHGFNFIQGTSIHGNSLGVIGVDYNSGGLPVVIILNTYTMNVINGNFIYARTTRGVVSQNSQTGVIGSAQCLNNASFIRIKWEGGGIDNWKVPAKYGAADSNGDFNLYVETNTLDNIAEGIDCDDDCRVNWRYNTLTNSGSGTHGTDTSGIMGGRYMDINNNTYIRSLASINGNGCPNLPANFNFFIFLRGGTALIHDNVIPDADAPGVWTGKSAVSFAYWNLARNAGGYPCWSTATAPGAGYPGPHQPGWGYTSGGTNPGSLGSNVLQDIEPIYLWNNTGSGNYANPGLSNFSPNECGGSAPDVSAFIHSGTDYILNTAKPAYTAYTYPHPLVDVSVDFLQFTTQPVDLSSGGTFSPTVVVTVRLPGGMTDTSATGNVVISIANCAASLTGTLTQAAVMGVATFTGMGATTAAPGFGCTLVATYSGATSGISNSFSVNAVSGPTLTSIFPSRSVRGQTIPITLTGTNFNTGGAFITVSGTGVTCGNQVIVSATVITANCTIAGNATTSVRTFTVSTDTGTSGTSNFTIFTQGLGVRPR